MRPVLHASSLMSDVVMYKAGADVNNRNRYGGVAAHAFLMTWSLDPATLGRAASALTYWLERGGNMDIADASGLAPRLLAKFPLVKCVICIHLIVGSISDVEKQWKRKTESER